MRSKQCCSEEHLKIQGSQNLHPPQVSRARIPALCGPGRKAVGVEQRRHCSSWSRGNQPGFQAGLLVGLLTQNKHLAPTVWLGNKASKKHTFMVNKPKERKTSREAKEEPRSQACQGAGTWKEPAQRGATEASVATLALTGQGADTATGGDVKGRSPEIEAWQCCPARPANVGKAPLPPGLI